MDTLLAMWSVTMVWDQGILSDFRLLLNAGRGREGSAKEDSDLK